MRQGLHPCLQFLWRMSSWGYWATERCGWSPALPRQTGWRVGRANRPDAPSFENGPRTTFRRVRDGLADHNNNNEDAGFRVASSCEHGTRESTNGHVSVSLHQPG